MIFWKTSHSASEGHITVTVPSSTGLARFLHGQRESDPGGQHQDGGDTRHQTAGAQRLTHNKGSRANREHHARGLAAATRLLRGPASRGSDEYR